MGRFTNRMIGFLQGRYGGDGLNRFLSVLCMVLVAVSFILRLLPISIWPSLGTSILAFLLLLYTSFRMFSRNIAARRRENARFYAVTRKLTGPFRRAYRRRRDPDHIYRKCPHCKKTLRLPDTPGDHTVLCPVCQTRFGLRVR